MKTRLQYIQIIRIISCLGVFCVHFGIYMDFGGILRKITDFGRYGVYLFFIISGFLALLSTENEAIVSLKNYYINRLIKIVPIYYLVITYFFIVDTVIGHNYNIPVDVYKVGWLRYFAFFNIFIPNATNYWDNIGSTWTIFVFLLFYILFPFMKRFAVNIKRTMILWGGAISPKFY